MHPTALAQIRKLERADLEVLLGVLHGAKISLRRDDSGDWNIIGGRGRIVCCNGSFTITIDLRSSRRWRSARRALASFTTCVQDGDGEGVLRIDHLPSVDEAARLRDVIGLRQTRPSPVISISSRLQGEFSANYAPKTDGGYGTPADVDEALATSGRALEGMPASGDQEAAE
jgi:hypothetical protein